MEFLFSTEHAGQYRDKLHKHNLQNWSCILSDSWSTCLKCGTKAAVWKHFGIYLPGKSSFSIHWTIQFCYDEILITIPRKTQYHQTLPCTITPAVHLNNSLYSICEWCPYIKFNATCIKMCIIFVIWSTGKKSKNDYYII